MINFQSLVFRYVCSGLLSVACFSVIFAQSTINNIPSTDILPKNKYYLEADFLSHFDSFQNGGFKQFGYRTVYGLNNKVEVGTNFFYTRQAGGRPLEIQPNYKFKVLDSEKHAFSVASGGVIFVPLNKASGTRTYAAFYTNASKVIRKANGLRVTAGIYSVANVRKSFGDKSGMILGFEQPLFHRINLTGDWFTGKNRFGYSTAGISYTPTARQFFLTTYNFGNAGRGNNFFSAFYGYTFD